MAEIFGTPRADVLTGTTENDIIRGGRGEDSIDGRLGDDKIFGGWGNDTIEDYDGLSEIWGGRGSDRIYFERGQAWGGLGNDTIICGDASWAIDGATGAQAIGGVGNDTIRGAGWLWGDQGPGTPPEQQTAGDDKLYLTSDTDGVWAHGGLGRDTFTVEPGDDCFAVIDDFHPGEDKIFAYNNARDEPENLFWRLDTNGNGILEGSDSAVDTDGTNLFLDLGADPNRPYLDETSLLTVRGVTQISAADWLFPDWAN